MTTPMTAQRDKGKDKQRDSDEESSAAPGRGAGPAGSRASERAAGGSRFHAHTAAVAGTSGRLSPEQQQSWGQVHGGLGALETRVAAPMKVGKITVTNVTRRYQPQMQRLLEVFAGHQAINAYIGDRPCRLTLVCNLSTPAEVNDHGDHIDVSLADWYFETHELGYLVGMLAHEFAIHPMASKAIGVAAGERSLAGEELPLRIDGVDKTVNSERSSQPDHIFGALPSLGGRGAIYRNTVIELAERLTQPKDITDLFDCYLMDCASILATDDRRQDGVFEPSLLAQIYNGQRQQLADVLHRAHLKDALPEPKTARDVLGAFGRLMGRLAKGYLVGGHSRGRGAGAT